MKQISIIFLYLSAISFSVYSQDVEVKRERVFTGTALYGFMNGGADLFFEFDVERLVNRDILFNGEEYTIDIYELPTAENAFGIYSMHVFRCERADTLGFTNCLSPYQYQAVAGNLYVSIVFPSGSAAAKRMAHDVLEYYVDASADNIQPYFPSFPGIESVYSGHVKFVRGPLSALNASVGMYNLVKDTPFYGAWFAAKKGEDTFRTIIAFESAADKNAFKEKLTTGSILEEDELYLYIEGQEPAEEENDAGPFGF